MPEITGEREPCKTSTTTTTTKPPNRTPRQLKHNTRGENLDTLDLNLNKNSKCKRLTRFVYTRGVVYRNRAMRKQPSARAQCMHVHLRKNAHLRF